MAIAERRLAAELNRPDHAVVDHWTYGICSDGDLQEGISAEAASLAGHLRLGKLVFLYDDNGIQLDGPTSWTFTENVLQRFDAYQWHTQRVADGEDLDAIEAAIQAAREDPRPSLIAVKTHIGFGSPKQDSQKAHGSPLGEEEVRQTKLAYGWDPDRTFYVPDDALHAFRQAVPRGEELVAQWDETVAAYTVNHPELAAELRRRAARRLPDTWDRDLPRWEDGSEAMATRNASQAVLQTLIEPLPELFGGSADLSESNLTDLKGQGDFQADNPGRNLRFGVREHAMGGISNGLAYHAGLLPYAATFLNFSDYMRGAVRLTALSGLHVVFVWTHDSVGLGEDGPTHQPVEHYAALRAMPNFWFVRPGDANETVAAWRLAIERPDGPVALALTRQKLPILPGTADRATEGVRRGAYVLSDAADADGTPELPDVILLATGSEVHLAMAARDELTAEGIRTRVVSMPCWERFEQQPQDYRDEVLPPNVTKRVSVEAGVSMGWDRWVGPEGAMICIERFGSSAPAADIFKAFGFTSEHVAQVARRVLTGQLSGIVSPPPDHEANQPFGGGTPDVKA
jgi:transketolase